MARTDTVQAGTLPELRGQKRQAPSEAIHSLIDLARLVQLSSGCCEYVKLIYSFIFFAHRAHMSHTVCLARVSSQMFCSSSAASTQRMRDAQAAQERRARRSMSARSDVRAALLSSRGSWQPQRSSAGTTEMRVSSLLSDLQVALSSQKWAEALRSFSQSFDASGGDSEMVEEAYSRLIEGGQPSCHRGARCRGAVVTSACISFFLIHARSRPQACVEGGVWKKPRACSSDTHRVVRRKPLPSASLPVQEALASPVTSFPLASF